MTKVPGKARNPAGNKSAGDDSADFVRLNKQFPLRPIRNDRQNELAASVCDALLDRRSALSQAERDYLEVLSDLILKYESKWQDDCEDRSPRALILSLMERHGLAQKDLVVEFGTASRVSEFLSGARNLSVEQARRLAERFSLNIDALLGSKDAA